MTRRLQILLAANAIAMSASITAGLAFSPIWIVPALVGAAYWAWVIWSGEL